VQQPDQDSVKRPVPDVIVISAGGLGLMAMWVPPIIAAENLKSSKPSREVAPRYF
jgi:hypothetical protein